MLVLKPEIEINLTSGHLELIDTLKKEVVIVEIHKDINEETFLYFLRNGICLNRIEDLTLEERVIIKIFKSKNTFFLVDIDKNGVRGNAIKHSIIHDNLKTGTSVKRMTEYLEKFGETEIFIIDDKTLYTDELVDAVKNYGFSNVTVSKKFQNSDLKKKNNIVIVAKENLKGSKIEYIPEVKYLCYSVKGHPEIGPIVIKNVTGCLTCASKSQHEPLITPQFFPMMIAFKLHYLFYLVDDLFTEIYQDVGLPLKKYYKFNTINFECEAYPFYRDLKCLHCAN